MKNKLIQGLFDSVLSIPVDIFSRLLHSYLLKIDYEETTNLVMLLQNFGIHLSIDDKFYKEKQSNIDIEKEI